MWEGDQILYEVRAPGSKATASYSVESDSPGGNGEFGSPNAYGRVGYTHAGGIDRPLGVIRMSYTSVWAAVYPETNWRGLYETATTDTGTMYANQQFVDFPGARATAFMGEPVHPDTGFYWFGSLLSEQADASGLMYRRNRYYDPASGRFTQPDPIGINGGLNEYGFAGGDPVNNTDPFGLWPGPDPLTVGLSIAVTNWLSGVDPQKFVAGAKLQLQTIAFALSFVSGGSEGFASDDADLAAQEAGDEAGTVATSELRATHSVSGKAVGRLARQVEADGGIREPLKYVTHEGEKYVVDGNHRLRVARQLGLDRVPADEVKLPYQGYRTPGDLTYTSNHH